MSQVLARIQKQGCNTTKWKLKISNFYSVDNFKLYCATVHRFLYRVHQNYGTKLEILNDYKYAIMSMENVTNWKNQRNDHYRGNH